jgi:peptidoglycan/LPS O-acetylase OafA/YrhL
MASGTVREAHRLDGVDFLRTLAILFVLMNHVNVRLSIAKVPFKQGLAKSLAHALFYNGQNGVRVFFAISGFLITSMSLRRWGGLANIDAKQFYRLRFARIAPLLLLLLAVLCALHLAHFPDYLVSDKRGGLWNALFAAFTFHVNLQEAIHGYLPGSWDILWSLSVEEVFYLAFPLACLLLRREKLLSLFFIAFVIVGPFARTVLAGGNALWSDYSYLSGMDAIALGCLTALFLKGRRLSSAALWASGLVGAGLMTLVLGLSIPVLYKTGLDMTVLALGACLVIVPAAQSGWRSPKMLEAILIPGRRSYEVYLTHMFVVFGLLHLFLWGNRPAWGVPLYFAATVLIATLAGMVVGRYFSDPANQALRAGRTS